MRVVGHQEMLVLRAVFVLGWPVMLDDVRRATGLGWWATVRAMARLERLGLVEGLHPRGSRRVYRCTVAGTELVR